MTPWGVGTLCIHERVRQTAGRWSSVIDLADHLLKAGKMESMLGSYGYGGAGSVLPVVSVFLFLSSLCVCLVL